MTGPNDQTLMSPEDVRGRDPSRHTRGDPVGGSGRATHTANRTRLAFLATLGHLHTEPLKYDLTCLRSLVEELEPDLLGVEAEPDMWGRGDLTGAPVEVRDALVPASTVTDTVIVPLGASLPLELAPPAEGQGADPRTEPFGRARARILHAVDGLLAGWQRDRAVQGPEAVNSRFFGHLCGLACSLEEAAAGEAGKRAWEEANGRILKRLLEMVRRDPGRRVLVAVNCRRVHWLETRLRSFADELVLVPYEQL